MSERKVSPFDFVTAINNTKRDLIREGEAEEADYVSFLVNRQLSYFPETVLDAQLMNERSLLDPQMQFDYLRLAIRKGKRFTKWGKREHVEDARLISEVFGFSINKSREALAVLTPEQLDFIKTHTKKGGVNTDDKGK
jgi:hypothetical protein